MNYTLISDYLIVGSQPQKPEDIDLLKQEENVAYILYLAGILATSHRNTVDGYDEMMASNYIGAFYLTKLLLPLLKNSPIPSRVVNVTSFTHRNGLAHVAEALALGCGGVFILKIKRN